MEIIAILKFGVKKPHIQHQIHQEVNTSIAAFISFLEEFEIVHSNLRMEKDVKP